MPFGLHGKNNQEIIVAITCTVNMVGVIVILHVCYFIIINIKVITLFSSCMHIKVLQPVTLLDAGG